MGKRIVALTTCGSSEEARKLAFGLTEARLAACVNIVPSITSVYRWKGKVEEATEFLLVIKSTADRVSELQAMLKQLHSYEVPEFIALPIDSGLPAYLAWIDEETKS